MTLEALVLDVDPVALLAIGGMGVATYATRLAGAMLLADARPGPKLKAALDAVPVAVLTAVIAPAIAAGGPPDWIAAAITVVAALRLPLLAVFSIGLASVIALRALM